MPTTSATFHLKVYLDIHKLNTPTPHIKNSLSLFSHFSHHLPNFSLTLSFTFFLLPSFSLSDSQGLLTAVFRGICTTTYSCTICSLNFAISSFFLPELISYGCPPLYNLLALTQPFGCCHKLRISYPCIIMHVVH